MNKFLGIVVLGLLLNIKVFAAQGIGKGELNLSDGMINYFMEYIQGKHTQSPGLFIMAKDGSWATYYYCPAGQGNCVYRISEGLHDCEKKAGIECYIFARKRVIKWNNGVNTGHYKKSSIKSKWSREQVVSKLTELGFIGESTSTSSSTTTKTTNKKKETKKVVKKYELKGDRAIALSWEDYESLIAGTVKFDEKDYKGTLNLSLPNNDGTCDGTYSLQEGGKGTWQIACSNNLGAAGTLKWTKNGGLTGVGRDHNDKKVKFTVSKDS